MATEANADPQPQRTPDQALQSALDHCMPSWRQDWRGREDEFRTHYRVDEVDTGIEAWNRIARTQVESALARGADPNVGTHATGGDPALTSIIGRTAPESPGRIAMVSAALDAGARVALDPMNAATLRTHPITALARDNGERSERTREVAREILRRVPASQRAAVAGAAVLAAMREGNYGPPDFATIMMRALDESEGRHSTHIERTNDERRYAPERGTHERMAVAVTNHAGGPLPSLIAEHAQHYPNAHELDQALITANELCDRAHDAGAINAEQRNAQTTHYAATVCGQIRTRLEAGEGLDSKNETLLANLRHVGGTPDDPTQSRRNPPPTHCQREARANTARALVQICNDADHRVARRADHDPSATQRAATVLAGTLAPEDWLQCDERGDNTIEQLTPSALGRKVLETVHQHGEHLGELPRAYIDSALGAHRARQAAPSPAQTTAAPARSAEPAHAPPALGTRIAQAGSAALSLLRAVLARATGTGTAVRTHAPSHSAGHAIEHAANARTSARGVDREHTRDRPPLGM